MGPAALIAVAAGVDGRRAGLRVGRALASGFGIGLVPLMGGTVASLVAVLTGGALLRLSPLALPFAGLSAGLGGLWAVRAADARDDPGWVVIDEFAGQWIAMLPLRDDRPLGLIAAFLLFRLLDIGKPWPVALADRSKTAAGVIGDDVLAGGLAAGVLWAIEAFWPRALG